MAHKSTPGALIHCEYCGEDFSATYKRCPFCGEKPSQNASEIPPKSRDDSALEDEYVFDGGDVFDEPEPDEEGQSGRKGDPGRRTAPKRGGSINWPRLITFICSLVIIVAALVIVFAYIYPKIHGHTPSTGDKPSASQSAQPSPSAKPTASAEPSATVEPSPSAEPTASAQPSAAPGSTVHSITLNKKEFTLLPDDSYTVTATVEPENWDGKVVWSTSNGAAAKVDEKGKVTNVNVGTSTLRVTITATAGDKTAEVTVYCRPGSTPGGGLSNGATGTITNVSTYLNVRSGPSKNTTRVGTLNAGDKITIVSDAGNGWYEINYAGGTGFIMGEYIKVDD